jgi:hypothetical protein
MENKITLEYTVESVVENIPEEPVRRYTDANKEELYQSRTEKKEQKKRNRQQKQTAKQTHTKPPRVFTGNKKYIK